MCGIIILQPVEVGVLNCPRHSGCNFKMISCISTADFEGVVPVLAGESEGQNLSIIETSNSLCNRRGWAFNFLIHRQA